MYIDKSIRNYLTLIEQGEPTPGGGSASSFVSNLGAALTLMTSNFSLNKDYFKNLDKDIQKKVIQAHNDIKRSRLRFNEFMDKDAKCFFEVIKTYEKVDFESEEDKEKTLEENYKNALDIPLKCSQECLNLLKLQDTIVEYGNNETISDVGVGVILAFAALEGCIISVKTNLNYIKDEDYVEKIRNEIDSIYKEASEVNSCIRRKVDDILNYT